MRAYRPSSLILTFMAAWLIGTLAVLHAAVPTLNIQRDPSGAKIAWNAKDGQDYILEGSNDLQTWVQVNQSIVKEGQLNRIFVPATQALNFYRLCNDGVRKQSAYVGSQTCSTCHSEIYDKFVDHGHGYKMNQVVNGAPPTVFSTQETRVPNTPSGWTWNDVSWMIGGALWKGRFIDQNGYIVTGDKVQYNVANKTWSGYEPTVAVGTKPYDCGGCHTTGWVAVKDGGVHQDGMPGMMGSFAAPGVQCEACHGAGSRHVATFGSKSEIIKDTSSALCGQCHIRGKADTIPAKGGFIQHHESYNEMLSAGHANHKCTTCHDPHVSATRGMAGAIRKACTDCHDTAKYTNNFHNSVADCVTCHMSYVTKSAINSNKYKADLKTHIFKINSAADGSMFSADGLLANGKTGVTLGYVCYQCHKDADGIGGSRSVKTLQELSEAAEGYHN